MNAYCAARSSRPARLFSLGLLDVPERVRLRRPLLREATAGFGLTRLATAFMSNPGSAMLAFLGRACQPLSFDGEGRKVIARGAGGRTCGGWRPSDDAPRWFGFAWTRWK